MQRPTNIYLVRHGQAECNRDGSIAGAGGKINENPLTEMGRRQAEALRDHLQDMQFSAILSSDLCRAAETAEIIASGNLPVQKLAALRERNFGSLEGQPDTVLRPYLSARKHMTPEKIWNTPIYEGVESDAHIYKRVLSCITQAVQKYAGKSILVVTHGGPIRTFLIGQGIVSEKTLPVDSVQHGSYIHLRWTHGEFTRPRLKSASK